MDKNYIGALKNRKAELLKELELIDKLLKIYPEQPTKGNKESSEKVHRNNDLARLSAKGRIMQIIKNLGGSAYVQDVAAQLKLVFPDKDDYLINNQVRNYIHILKKEGKLKPEFKEHNKYLYHLSE